MIPFATQTIDRLRATVTVDARNNAVEDWETPDVLSIEGCNVQPGMTMEELVNRDTTLIQWTVLAPPDADVRPNDRIDYRGIEYEIDGMPAAQPSPTGALNHLVILLKRWEG